MPRVTQCPVCLASVPENGPFFPYSSEACRAKGEAHKSAKDRWRRETKPRLYKDTKAWDSLTGALKANGNVFCARIINGEQCGRLAQIFHHLIAPEDRPDLTYDQNNVIPLCRGCHPPTQGTPDWKPGIDYVPNTWKAPRVA